MGFSLEISSDLIEKQKSQRFVVQATRPCEDTTGPKHIIWEYQS